jgi:hypothetical protein
MAVGTWGIYLKSPLWSLFYLLYSIGGFTLVILPGLCAHCPYPYRFSTCLFFPLGLLKRYYPYKGPRMSRAEKIFVAVVMAGIFIFPQFWLLRQPGTLAVFWLLALPVLIVFPLYYCRRCRHVGCPMNRVADHKVELHEG